MEEFEQYKQLFDRNIDRVCSLRRIYNTLRTNNLKEEKEYKFTDILRSAVVMLHSAFEEYYRGVLKYILPKICTNEELKGMSFLRNPGKYKEKITLSELIQYRGKTVDEIVTESIQETLSCTSFNDYQDIVFWSKKIRIDLDKFNEKEKLNKLIRRRHKIVHKADKANNKDKYALDPIYENIVKEWINIVCNLVNVINEEIQNKYKKMKGNELK